MDREQIASAVHALIATGPEGDTGIFDALALELFAYQYANNAP